MVASVSRVLNSYLVCSSHSSIRVGWLMRFRLHGVHGLAVDPSPRHNLPDTQMRLNKILTPSGALKMAVLLAFASATATLFAQQPTPDLILSNGKIITVDERFRIAQAVAIQGDRIVAVGTNQEMAQLAGTNTRRIDLMGRAVTPGLIDNHMHLLRAATTWLRELRFDGVDSRKQAIGLLRARVKAAGAGEWVYNIGGWTHQQFADDPKPFTREELDQIAPNNPVSLQESYYQVFLNSAALQALGIEANKPDPQGFVPGSIQRDASGRPTGVIRGDIPATRPVAAKLPKVAPDQLEASTRTLVEDMNRAGLTAVGVPGCNADVLE